MSEKLAYILRFVFMIGVIVLTLSVIIMLFSTIFYVFTGYDLITEFIRPTLREILNIGIRK